MTGRSVKGKVGPLFQRYQAARIKLTVCAPLIAAATVLLSLLLYSYLWLTVKFSLGDRSKLLHRPVGFKLYPCHVAIPLKLKDAINVCCWQVILFFF